MTSYDGESCVYDANGNPTTYRGKALTWTRGRLLETYPSLASPHIAWTFTYNADGIRVGKSAPSVTTTYGVDGERIVYEKTNGQIKRYFYDESGIAGFEYGGQKYVFRKNLQGDVVGICSSSGTLIGEYVYDAWGNLLEEPTNGVLLANPFRYRGYYYDTSIGLYYLNSRYYDPETGRFLNEDLVSYLEPETIGGINLYAYCLNDPVNNTDPSGHFASGIPIQILISLGSYLGYAIAAIWDEEIRSDMSAIGWNPFNSDAQATVSSNKVSFYKGVPIFRTGFGNRSGSFYLIGLAKGDSENDLMHEWGHSPVYWMLGPLNGAITMALPSGQKWGGNHWVGWENYYRRPWEAIADMIGGASTSRRLYAATSDKDKQIAVLYLLTAYMFGPAAYLFLI